MIKINKIAKIYTLPVLLAWFLMTVFVDIIAVPTVFRNVTSVEQAGKVGMTVFTTFNRIELLFGLVGILGAVYIFKLTKRQFPLILATVLFLAVSYNVHFTPQIKFWTEMIHSVKPFDPQMGYFQTQHHFYHTLYRYLDTTKLILLLISLFIWTKINLTEEK